MKIVNNLTLGVGGVADMFVLGPEYCAEFRLEYYQQLSVRESKRTGRICTD